MWPVCKPREALPGIDPLTAPKPSRSSPPSLSWFEREGKLGCGMGEHCNTQGVTEWLRPQGVREGHRLHTDVRPNTHSLANQLLTSVSKFICHRRLPTCLEGRCACKMKNQLIFWHLREKSGLKKINPFYSLYLMVISFRDYTAVC